MDRFVPNYLGELDIISCSHIHDIFITLSERTSNQIHYLNNSWCSQYFIQWGTTFIIVNDNAANGYLTALHDNSLSSRLHKTQKENVELFL